MFRGVLGSVTVRLVAALVLLLAGAGGAGLAQNRPSPELLEEQISSFEAILTARQAELERLQNELSATNTELDAQLTERDRLAGQVQNLSAQQAGIRRQTETLQQRQRASAARVRGLERQANGLKVQLQRLIVSLHKERQGQNLRALAESESLFELRVKNYYLARLTQQDVALLDTFNRATAELSAARAQRARQVRGLRAQARALSANQQALSAAQNDLEAVIATLGETRAGQLAQQEALLTEQSSIETDLTGARSALAAELERLREEAARQAALEAAANAEANAPADDTFATEADRLERLIRGLDDPNPTTERAFAAPFPDAVVARPYGEGGATDIWLRAPQPGSAVRAVKSGVVYRASLITANSGYTVAIQHGPELISAYTNLQLPVVELGDRVEQGQILGYLGGGIVPADILQLRLGRPSGLDIIYQDPAPLLGLGAG